MWCRRKQDTEIGEMSGNSDIKNRQDKRACKNLENDGGMPSLEKENNGYEDI